MSQSKIEAHTSTHRHADTQRWREKEHLFACNDRICWAMLSLHHPCVCVCVFCGSVSRLCSLYSHPFRFHPQWSRSYLTQIYCVVNVDRRHIKKWVFLHRRNEERPTTKMQKMTEATQKKMDKTKPINVVHNNNASIYSHAWWRKRWKDIHTHKKQWAHMIDTENSSHLCHLQMKAMD